MNPISRDRLKWVKIRLFLLDMMIKEISTRPARYAINELLAQQLDTVKMTLLQEKIQLAVEGNVLEEYMNQEDARLAEAHREASMLGTAKFNIE